MVLPEGQASACDAVRQFTTANQVSPGYHDTLGMRLVRGRDVTEMDRAGSPLVVLINEAMAKQFWKDQDALGKRFKFFGDQQFRQVVGITRDTKIFSLGEDPLPHAFIPALQLYTPA